VDRILLAYGSVRLTKVDSEFTLLRYEGKYPKKFVALHCCFDFSLLNASVKCADIPKTKIRCLP
jgi:hypothetical protein